MTDVQGVLYFVTLLFAVFTAITSFLVVHELFRNKSKLLFSNILPVVFSLLAFGYACFALAEVTWFVIFDIFNQLPSVSMPDLYWFVGSLSLLAGFATFSSHMYQQHGQLGKGIALLSITALVLGFLLYFVLSSYLIPTGKPRDEIFVGYFYPITSLLILISSVSVYLFFDRVQQVGNVLLILALANLAIFVGDVLYTYYKFDNIYGTTAMASDVLYALAYLLCAGALFTLWRKIRQGLDLRI